MSVAGGGVFFLWAIFPLCCALTPPLTSVPRSDLSLLTRINPRAYGRETARELARVFGLQVDSSTVTRWLEVMRLSRKRYNSRRVRGSGLCG